MAGGEDLQDAAPSPLQLDAVALTPSFTSPAITTADLAPPPCPPPRPWQRVPVSATSRHLGLRTIWKRVAGIAPRISSSSRDAAAAVELRADGRGARKRLRGLRHVPRWQDVPWAARADGRAEDGVSMLAAAKEAISSFMASMAQDDAPTAHLAKIRKATFPEDRLVYVPRKRNSRRVPLQPEPTTEPTVASAEAVDVPDTADVCDDAITNMDESSNITTRTKRRMSRRLSVQPRQLSVQAGDVPSTPQPKKPVSTSRRRVSMPASFPTLKQQQQVANSPMASPFKGFTVSATPMKVILEQPDVDGDEDMATPSKSAPPEDVLLAPVVVFDQLAEEDTPEPAHETRRRQSLYRVRHSDRWSSAAERQLSIQQNSKARRRHSLGARQLVLAVKANSKSRRHTLQLMVSAFPSADEMTLPMEDETTADDAEHKNDATSSRYPSIVVDDATTSSFETLDVDVRTNLDIFGSGSSRLSKSPSPVPAVVQPMDTLPDVSADAETFDMQTDEVDGELLHDDVPIFGTAASPMVVSPLPNHGSLITKLPTPPRANCAEDATLAILFSASTGSAVRDGIATQSEQSLVSSPDLAATPCSPSRGVQADQDAPMTNVASPGSIKGADSDPAEADLLLSPPTQIAEEAAAPAGNSDAPTPTAEGDENAMDLYGTPDLSTKMELDMTSSAPVNEEEEDHEALLALASPDSYPNDDDATVTMTMDLDDLAEGRPSLHEDSETEMLRKFVTRFKADKTAKAAAAAAAARNRMQLRHKRRSGSMGSTASSVGSPVSKREMASIVSSSPFPSRTPLGKKDHNMSPSPSPTKKRKAVDVEKPAKSTRSKELLSEPALEDTSPRRPKRRRKKMETDTGGIFNPEFMPASKSQAGAAEAPAESAGPRRSKRTRTQLTPSKSAGTAGTAGTSANGVLSLIPVRLPGSLNLNGDDSYGGLSLRRSGEKDLAAVTRVNTRKNKFKAEPPCVVLARQSQDTPLVIKEQQQQRSVFDPPSSGSTADEDDLPPAKGASTHKKRSAKASKVVRWAEVLVRVQGHESKAEEPAKKTESATEGTVQVSADAVEVSEEKSEKEKTEGETLDVPTIMPTVMPTLAAPEPEKKKAIPRRTTRASRLQPPTPRKVIAAAAAKSAAAAENTPPPAVAKVQAAAAPRMATRRTKVLSMGMSGNGTPAPKRRAHRTA